MKIGQRINLLKKIARRLSEHSFSDGDLILRQFDLPCGSWSYCIYQKYLGAKSFPFVTPDVDFLVPYSF